MRVPVVLDAFDGVLQQVDGVFGQLDRLVWMTVTDQVREQLQRAGHSEGVGRRLVPPDGAIAFSRIMVGALATDPSPSVVELWERAREALAFIPALGSWGTQAGGSNRAQRCAISGNGGEHSATLSAHRLASHLG